MNLLYNTYFHLDDNLNAVVPSGGKSYKFIAADDNSAKNKQSTLDKTTVGLFNAPSILPKNNPALRVYSYDISGGKYPIGTVRDWDQYYVDLDKANSERTLKFELEYKASKLYGVDHFDGAGVGQAVLNIGKNKSSRDLYKKYAGVST
jgi:hypothetical protein